MATGALLVLHKLTRVFCSTKNPLPRRILSGALIKSAFEFVSKTHLFDTFSQSKIAEIPIRKLIHDYVFS